MNLKDFKHVHCIGIGGIGLSAIAEIFNSRGYKVTGSDVKESTVSQSLEEQGIKVFIGHDKKNVEDANLLIYSAAVSMENPEIVVMLPGVINDNGFMEAGYRGYKSIAESVTENVKCVYNISATSNRKDLTEALKYQKR